MTSKSIEVRWPWKEWPGSSRDRAGCNVLALWCTNWGKWKETSVRTIWVLAETGIEECLRWSLIHKTEGDNKSCAGAMGFCYMRAGYLSCHTYAAGGLQYVSTVNMHTTSCSRHTVFECWTLPHWRSYLAQLYLNIMEISRAKEILRWFVCVSRNSSIMASGTVT
jgi:hypothetical protein